MADEYCRNILRVSLAQICQNLGWNAAQATPLELLTDVLERYLLEVAKVTHRYSEQFGRTDPNLDDLGLAFGHLGIQLGELEDYVHHVDPLPFAHEVVAFPAPKRNNLQFPKTDSKEVVQREEHIPEHLPAMFPEEIETPQSPQHTQPETSLLAPPPTTPIAVSPSDIQVDGAAVSPGLSDKRLLTSPPSGGPPSKRIRLTSLPEEAAHSQYEMRSMAMNVVGEVMPTGGYIGKLPDAKTPPQGFPKRFPKDNTRGSSSKSAPILAVARDLLSELNSKKDSTEGSQKKDKDKTSSNSSSKKSGVKKKSNTSSERKDVSKSKSKVKKSLLTPKSRPRSRSKSPARAKSPKGGGIKKGQIKVLSDSGAGLFSETIMLERQKGPSVDKGRSSSPSIKIKDESHNNTATSHKNRDSPRSTPLDLSCKQKISKPNDLEEKKRRLDAIQNSIDSVLRRSALNQPEQEPDIPDNSLVPLDMEADKVEESKPMEKIKDLNTSSSIDDTINAVIGAVDRPDTQAVHTPVAVKEEAVEQDVVTPTPALPPSPVVTTPVVTPQTSPRKKGRPPKKGKNKGNKKPSTPPVAPPVVEPPPIVEPKSPKDEKFAVFDFPESPPMRSTPKPAPPTPAPPTPAPPPTAPRSPSPPPPVVEPPPVVVEEPPPPVIEESLVKVKVESSPVTATPEKSHSKVKVEENSSVTPTLEKSHSKDKDKHKSKEHKKEKKEKKKDKEKKKKNKDKDRDKERSKHKDKSSKSPGTFPTGLTKLKIRLGSSPFSSTVTYSSQAKDQSPSGSPAQRPEIPKLVIKPMPPLPSSQDRGSDSPKTSSSSSKSSKKEGKSKKDVSHIVVKKEVVPEKLPPTPPPVARTPSPAPAPKTPSPVKKTPSPVKREPSPVPPPRSITPVPPPKAATPVPKFVDSPDRSSRDEPPILKMELMDEPPVLTPQPSPRRQTPTPPPPRNLTQPRVPTIKPAPSPIPSPKHSPSPERTYSPSPVRANSPLPSAFTSKSMSSSPVKTPSPSRTRTPSPVPSLPPSPIHHPSPTPSPTPTKPPTPSPTPTPAHSPGPLVIKEGPIIPPMPPPSIGTPSQASVTAKTALQRTVTSETIGSFIDVSSGEKVWICPACKRQDDGSPMVGCDICDDWYHWECIGINKEPEEDSWYCNKCLAPTRKPSKRGRGGGRGRGRGRGRKKSLKE